MGGGECLVEAVEPGAEGFHVSLGVGELGVVCGVEAGEIAMGASKGVFGALERKLLLMREA